MNRWRAVALELCAGVVFALIVVPIVAQSKPEPVDTGSGLKLRLVIPDPNVCVDSKLVAFEIVLMNEGEQPIAVYKSSLSEFVFTRDKREQGKTTTQTFEDDKDTAAEASAAAKDPSITIMPRSYIVIPFKYDVAAAFFYGGDVYSLRVGYRDIATRMAGNAFNGHVKSNAALFRRIGCE